MLPFSTAFVAANGTLLTAFSARFFNVAAIALWIQGNRAVCPVSGPPLVASGCAGVTDALWQANQYAQCVMGAMANSYMGPCVRCQGAGSGSFYAYLGAVAGVSYLVKYNAGVLTVLNSNNPPFAPGDVIRIEAVGNTLSCFVNGAATISAVDATFPTGKGGIGGLPNGSDSAVVSLLTGNMSGPTSDGSGIWPMGAS